MGQEIVYCSKCRQRLTTGDFEKGLGVRVGPKVSCADCLPSLLATFTPEEQQEAARQRAGRPSGPRLDPPRGSSSKHTKVRPAGTRATPSSSRSELRPGGARFLPAVVAGAAALLVVIVLAVASKPGPAAPAQPPPPPPAKPTSEDPRVRAAREAVAQARKAPRNDLDAQIAAWSEAVKVSEGTPFFKEATETHGALVDERAAGMSRDMAGLDAQARALIEREEFRAAAELYERARGRRTVPEWREVIDSRVRDVRSRADALFSTLKAKAADARRKGAEEEVNAVRERVARWQFEGMPADFDRFLAAVARPERPWKPMFDGKTTEFLNSQSRPGWEVRDGALVRLVDNAAQTVMEIGDGELRVQFEAADVENLWFNVRQAGTEGFTIVWNTAAFKPLEGRRCELIFTCRGDSVTATVNGQPLPLQATAGRPRKGRLQFNGSAKMLRYYSFDFRDLP